MVGALKENLVISSPIKTNEMAKIYHGKQIHAAYRDFISAQSILLSKQQG